MASKYAGLKGKIPEQQTARDVALIAELEALESTDLNTLTASYNTLIEEAADLAAKVKKLSIRKEAREILIRKRLDAIGGDGVKGLNGYTWSEGFEPYPVCDDPAAAVKYFRDNGMEDQLELKASEINSRLANFVKEEGLKGELTIETKMVKDDQTGEEKEVTEVRSKVPGVRVYMHAKLSRVKSKATSKKE